MNTKHLLGAILMLMALFTTVRSQADRIAGLQTAGMEDTLTYTAEGSEISSCQWAVPRGFRILSGQGTATLRLRSTFLSQDGKVTAVRTLKNGTRDTLSLTITVYREVEKVVDDTIQRGGSIVIDGKRQTEPDIYYEKTGETEGRPLYTAHRLTVLPPEAADFTKPYLQVMTDSSVWVCWKTKTSKMSRVAFGTSATDLNRTATGDQTALSSDYYWHSVHLTGLQETTSYYYRIANGGDTTVYRFRTLPRIGSRKHMRILLMGDHQVLTRSGAEWLLQAARRNIEKRYGDLIDHLQFVLSDGDQVDRGTLEQYERVNLYKMSLLSPDIPVMTTVGNHETYNDTGMAIYGAHFHYENLSYKGIISGTDNYYAYQAGRALFVVLSSDHTGSVQKAWVRRVVDAAKVDTTVDFIISVNHRPIQAEQYVGDMSQWVRNEIVPILGESGKHVLNFSGHHHLYARGQEPQYPFYHIINGGASWNQLWGMSTEQDFSDVQKTIDYWGYQILDLDYSGGTPSMNVDCYSIGNCDIVRNDMLIDHFHRIMNQPSPEQPTLAAIGDTITLPVTFRGSAFRTAGGDSLNTVEFQIAGTPDFSAPAIDKVRDVEDFFGSTGKPLRLPLDVNENVDITQFTVANLSLKNGRQYIRVRYRDANLEWSPWSETDSFVVKGSRDGDPNVILPAKRLPASTSFTLTYQYSPVGTKAWVGIYRRADTPKTNTATKWAYTTAESGTLTFALPTAGEYYAVLFKDGGYTEISPRIHFFVGGDMQVSTSRKVYNEGDSVTVVFSGAPLLSKDWMGIYGLGDTPGDGSPKSWLYMGTAASGTMGLSTGKSTAAVLPKGYYFVSYFVQNAYFEPYKRQYFAVGSDNALLQSRQPDYKPGQTVTIDCTGAPGLPGDRIVFYVKDSVSGSKYIADLHSVADTTLAVPYDSLPPADYRVALFMNGSFEPVAPIVSISVGKAPLMTLTNNSGHLVRFAFPDDAAWRNAVTSVWIDGKQLTSYTLAAGELSFADTGLAAGSHQVVVKAAKWQDDAFSFTQPDAIRSQGASVLLRHHQGTVDVNSEKGGCLQVWSVGGAILWQASMKSGQQQCKLPSLSLREYILVWKGEDGRCVSCHAMNQ